MRLEAAPDARTFVVYVVTWIGPWPLKPSLRAVAAREVVLAPAHVGAAVDHRDAHDAPRWRSVTFVPHGSDLLADAERAGVQRPAAAQLVAEQARAVPRARAPSGRRSGARAIAVSPLS